MRGALPGAGGEGEVEEGRAAELRDLFSRGRPADEIALRVSKACVFRFFEGEEGLPVWQSLKRLPQLVQVRLLPGSPPGRASCSMRGSAGVRTSSGEAT